MLGLILLLATGELQSLDTTRPSEDSMFGAPEGDKSMPDGGALVAKPEAAPPTAQLPAPELPPNNPLTIGGLLYLRSQVSGSENEPPDQWLVSAPFLMDVYFDARPNDRVRAFALLRTEWDPTYNPSQSATLGLLPATLTPSSSCPAGSICSATTDLLIDQMWIKFDIDRKVFVTAGRQHVKWGTAHFWFPNDLLNPVKLTPLAVFDQRTGVTMVKANLPLPDQNLNLYGMALFEGLEQANQFGKLGGALRAEYVLGTVEAGLDMVSMLGQHNRYGGDVSFGIWDFDLYAEAALTNQRDNPLWSYSPVDSVFLFDPANYAINTPSTYQPQVAAGLNYSFRYGNNRTVVMGGEYFYNGLGYTNPIIYPWLLVNDAATFFYLGQQYAGLYILADKPLSFYNSTINFSTLGNLSDHTFISRIDFFQQVLTHLRVEAFADVHYGGNGEFHYSLDIPSFGSFPGVDVTAPIFDVGVALRVSL